MNDARKDVFTFRTSQEERQPGATEQLIAKMAENMPLLPELLALPTTDEQVALLKEKLPPRAYDALLMMLITIGFNYEKKDNLLDKALMAAKLRYRLAQLLPPEWDPDVGFGLSPTRQTADALRSLGDITQDMGDLSLALDYYQQAEECYLRDDAEQARLGITRKGRNDRVFGERDIQASLYEAMGRLYEQLGDKQKSGEYARRMRERDQQHTSKRRLIDQLSEAGWHAMEAGDYEHALRLLDEALDLAVADTHSQVVVTRVVTACHHMGETLSRLKLFRQALRYHRRALELNRQAGHAERMSYDHRALGTIFQARPDLGNALEEYLESLRCTSAEASGGGLFNWNAPDGTQMRVVDPDLAWPVALAMGQLYWQQQDYENADLFLELAIDLGEIVRSRLALDAYRIGFQSSRLEAYDDMIVMHSQLAIEAVKSSQGRRGDAVRAWRYVEGARSRTFLDLLSMAPIRAPDEIPANLLQGEAELLERLRVLSQAVPEHSTAQKRGSWEEFEQTRASLEQVWQKMLESSPAALPYIGLRRGHTFEANAIRALLEG